MKKNLLLLLVIFGTGIHTAHAQSITAAQILQNMKQQFELVEDYTATLRVSADMERMQIPEMLVTIYFKQPDKVHIEAKNFAMVPREAVALNPTQLIDKFDATLVGTEHRGDSTLYKLRLVSKPEKGKPVRESYVWVDGGRWVATHLEVAPSDVRKISVDLEYQMVNEKFLLPSKITAQMETQQRSDSTAERMYSPQRLPRKGSVTIQYSDYKINTNLSDDIFEKKKGKQ